MKTTNDKIKEFDSLLSEKQLLNGKLNKVYELALSENYDEALYELEAINRRYPYIVDVYHIKFKIYCIKENYTLAEKVLREAEVIFSENEKIIEDRAYLTRIKNSLNNEYLRNMQYEELVESTERDIRESDPHKMASSSYYYRALSYRMLNNRNANTYYDEACKVYNNITPRKNMDYSTYLYKALCYKDMKDYGEALKIVNSILEKDCNNKEAFKVKLSIIKELKSKRI